MVQVARRRKREGVNDYTDMLHFNDMMGTAREDLSTVGFAKVEVNPTEVGSEVQGTPNGYVVTADGEPLAMTQPSDLENHIQFHGGFLEDKNFHTNPLTDGVMGYFYRMGIRHYSPSLGRFLQRDPFSYLRAPPKGHPLNLNPYIYGNNRPTQLSDRSGYQACPGCGTPSGGITPMIKEPRGPGFGQDGSSGGGHGGGGGGGWGNDETDCAVYYPEECIDDEDYPNCTRHCCRKKSDPFWWQGCCCGECLWLDFSTNLCTSSNEPGCECACCWADGGGENAPTPIAGGGGGFGGGSSGSMGPILGPPSIGPWGDGGDPWWFGPVPYSPLELDKLQSATLIPYNSIYKNHSLQSNLHNSISQNRLWVYNTTSKSLASYVKSPMMGFGWGHAAGAGLSNVIFMAICDIGKAHTIKHMTSSVGLEKEKWCDKLECLCSACMFCQYYLNITAIAFGIAAFFMGPSVWIGWAVMALPCWLALIGCFTI